MIFLMEILSIETAKKIKSKRVLDRILSCLIDTILLQMGLFRVDNIFVLLYFKLIQHEKLKLLDHVSTKLKEFHKKYPIIKNYPSNW